MPRDPIQHEPTFPAEPSDRVAALMLEMDSALHEGRKPVLSDSALRKLSPDEQRQLQEFYAQLGSVYGQLSAPGKRNRLPKTTMNIAEVHAAGDDTSDVDIQFNHLASWGIHSDVFGRFQILRALGMGGHGVVFLAHDPKLARPVAVKVPRPEVLVQAAMRKRFLAEGRAAAMLMHPNIVTVFESGEVGSICYLAQDYIPGPSLADWLDQHPQPVPPRVAAEIILQLAEAVSLAHGRKILHRDIKPGNILLAPLPSLSSADALESFQPKLADFGIAKLLQDGDQTQTGSILGTPAYMSPERASGRRELIGERSDIYGLGTILYELLTHHPLFHGENDLQTLQLVLHSDPPPPRALVPGIPVDLEAICLKCVEKEAEQRYATAGELANDLRRYLRGEHVVARRYKLLQRVTRYARQPQIQFRLVESLLVVSILGLGVASWLAWQREQAFLAEQIRSRGHEQRIAIDRDRRYPQDLRLAMQLLSEPSAGNTERQRVSQQARAILEQHIPRAGEPDPRGFAWHYLWKVLNPSKSVPRLQKLHEIAAHHHEIYFVAFSRDGRKVVTSSQDHAARVFDVATGKLLATLTGHEDDVNCAEFSPDGKYVATASDDGTVALWDAESGERHRVLWKNDPAFIVGVAFNPANGELAASASDGTVRVWNLLRTDAQHSYAAEQHPGARIDGITYSPDGRLLATVSGRHGLKLWNADRSYEPYHVLSNYPFPATAACFSPDGKYIGIASAKEIRILRNDTGQLVAIQALTTPGPHVRSLQFHNNSRLLLVAGDPLSTGIHDWLSGDFWHPFDRPSHAWNAAFSRTGDTLAMVDQAGSLRLWNSTPFNSLASGVLEISSDAALSPDGTRLAMIGARRVGEEASAAPVGSIWNIAEATPSQAVRFDLPEVHEITSELAYSPDGQELAVGMNVAHKTECWIYDAATGMKRRQAEIPHRQEISPVQRIVYSPDGAFLFCLHGAGGKKGREWRVYERSTGKFLRTHYSHAQHPLHGPFPRAFAPRGDAFVTTTTNEAGRIDVWSVPGLEKKATWASNKGPVFLLSFLPDGKSVLAYFGSGHCAQLDFATGQTNFEFAAKGVHGLNHERAFAFSANGRLAALANSSGVALIHIPSGDLLYLLPFSEFVADILRLEFSANDQALAAIVRLPQNRAGVYFWQVHQAGEPAAERTLKIDGQNK